MEFDTDTYPQRLAEWQAALAKAHAEGAHGDDASRYWRQNGCEACASRPR